MNMMKQVAGGITLITLLSACGGSPKAAWDRALGREKKDKPFVADITRLKGAYMLTSVKKWEGSGSTTYGVGWNNADTNNEPHITLFFRDGGVEIASRTDAPIKTCSSLQTVSQGPGNRLEIAGSEACPALSFEIVQQDLLQTVMRVSEFACPRLQTGMCTGLVFETTPEFRVGELMYGWPVAQSENMPPTINSLQIADIAQSDLQSVRSGFKDALTAASVSLNQDLALQWGGGIPRGNLVVLANGQVFATGELIENMVRAAGSFETSCVVVSQKQLAVQTFTRKIANVEATHTNRAEGLWTYAQLHEGLDSVLTAEQRRAPVENTFATTRSGNSVRITIEAADSEQNGNGIRSDRDLEINCTKSQRATPITIDDVRKALGEVITFAK